MRRSVYDTHLVYVASADFWERDSYDCGITRPRDSVACGSSSARLHRWISSENTLAPVAIMVEILADIGYDAITLSCKQL